LADWQVPFPSQACAFSAKTPPEQAADAHGVFAGNIAQDPEPSQSPVVPQVEARVAGHWFPGSGRPKSTGLQRPIEPGRSHETHGPSQATLQQWSLATKPERHSAEVLAAAPFSFFPQLPAIHACPAAH
jgi:hypothetical protein